VLIWLKQLRAARHSGDREVSSIMFNRVLLAIDDSDSSEVALSFATAVALQSSGAVRVVHVNEYLVGGRGFTIETQAEAISRLEGAVATLRAAGIPTEGSLYLTSCFGVDARIVNAAHEWSADVIVLGSRRRRRFARLGGKGMRERVTSLTALPVLTAPAPLEVASGNLSAAGGLSTDQLTPFPSISR
jgi:nucleotide-binding universal stress UspA family protein